MRPGVSAASPSSCEAGGHGGVGLRRVVAEVSERRESFGKRQARWRNIRRRGRRTGRWNIVPAERKPSRLVPSVPRLMRIASFLPTPGASSTAAQFPNATGVREILRRQHAEDTQRHLGADTLDRLQRPEPAPLELALKTEQPDRVLAHMRVDRQRYVVARLQVAQRPLSRPAPRSRHRSRR